MMNPKSTIKECWEDVSFKVKAENPTLSEVRRSSSMWKKALGINIYEMLTVVTSSSSQTDTWQNRFSRENGCGREANLLEWWNPTAGCVPLTYKLKSTWIRTMGTPMHL